jgi:hypothetical protein
LVNIERKKMHAWLAALVRAVLAPVRLSYSAVRSSLLGQVLPSRRSLTRRNFATRQHANFDGSRPLGSTSHFAVLFIVGHHTRRANNRAWKQDVPPAHSAGPMQVWECVLREGGMESYCPRPTPRLLGEKRILEQMNLGFGSR